MRKFSNAEEFQIAATCHEVNRTLCDHIGELTQGNWHMLTDEQRADVVKAVRSVLKDRDITEKKLHENWVREKLENGWRYNKAKNYGAKEHPCLVPYEALPPVQQLKDELFLAVVNSFF